MKFSILSNFSIFSLQKQELLNIYTVIELDKSYEGIMLFNVSAKH